MKKNKSCFVMMPFSDDFITVFETVVSPAVESNNLNCIRADEILDPGIIIDQIQKEINDSIVCIADLTGLNRNVVYEVALAHAAGKSVVLITRDDPLALPFDLRYFRVFKYSSTKDGLIKLEKELSKILSEVVKQPDSPVKNIENMLFPQSIEKRKSPFVIAASPLSWRDAAKPRGCSNTCCCR